MKQIKVYLFALLAVLSMAACGSSNDGDGNGSNEINTNKNEVTSDKCVTRLEFPKLKGGNSIIRVYRDGNSKQYDPDNVNYSVEWDCDKKSQRWSCYIITTKNRAKNTDRYKSESNQYPNDPELAASNRWEKDYIYRSGFDHGHICNSQDRLYSFNANYQTFFLTNMQPQYKVFNGSHPDHKYEGLWIKMENYLHGFKLNDTDTMYVCKGGTIDKEENILMRIQNKLIVPKYFFVAVLVKKMVNGQAYYKSIGMWFPHTNVYHGDDKLSDYTMSIKDLEAKTGIDFFCNLPDNIEQDVESKKILSDWGSIEK
nr:DNA/RNA non-specific endonuclease [uncultured Prevotella sp.]